MDFLDMVLQERHILNRKDYPLQNRIFGTAIRANLIIADAVIRIPLLTIQTSQEINQQLDRIISIDQKKKGMAANFRAACSLPVNEKAIQTETFTLECY
ncbi:unnamed protein product [Angiostrongylus costaricensis]|uniref:Fic_N domain-containing protein n=1 Tax=Angiostrongylus costaricensis TaxID=334426 RepID=A0A0R3PU87_ANGCS|nr:unnamed protein product [Angiostrongylus costaricensis]